MVLHGYTSNAADQDRYFGVSALAEEKGFLSRSQRHEGGDERKPVLERDRLRCNFEGNTVDDVAYLSAVIADMKRQFNVIRSASSSQGTQRRLHGSPHGLRALGRDRRHHEPRWRAVPDPARCKPDHPVAVLQVHGDQDETVNYEGGELFAGPLTLAPRRRSPQQERLRRGPRRQEGDLRPESTLDGSETWSRATRARRGPPSSGRWWG